MVLVNLFSVKSEQYEQIGSECPCPLVIKHLISQQIGIPYYESYIPFDSNATRPYASER